MSVNSSSEPPPDFGGGCVATTAVTVRVALAGVELPTASAQASVYV
jgi:hypothetical protein